MTDAQREAIRSMCEGNGVHGEFVESDYRPASAIDGLPDGWVVGVVGSMFIGCSPDGRIHT